MNIFALNKDPAITAQYHHDKHVLKMIVESAQLLSGAWHSMYPSNILKIYLPTHLNHPCAKWVRESRENYEWLWELGFFLCYEYRVRYKNVHKTEEYFRGDLRNSPMRCGSLTTFPQVMPENYRQENSIRAYQSYYRHVKSVGQKWTERNRPEFLDDFLI